MPSGNWIGLASRLTDLVCDALVVGLLLVAVKTGAMSEATGVAAIGYALRSLVQPSLALGIFKTPTDPTPRTNGGTSNGSG